MHNSDIKSAMPICNKDFGFDNWKHVHTSFMSKRKVNNTKTFLVSSGKLYF